MVSIDQYCKLASSKLGEIRGKNMMLSLTPKSVHRALRETSTTCQISADGQRVVIDGIPDDDVSSSARALSGAPASSSARASSGAPASSSAGSAPLSTTAMRGLWHIPLNGELGVARHSLHKLWKSKGLPIDILLLVLEFAYRAFEDILTSHHAQCDEGYCSPCWHEERILKLAADHRTWRSAPETCRFPCHLISCGGNVLIIDNILPQITPTQGKYGRMVLSDSWKVYVIEKNDHSRHCQVHT